MSDMYGFELYSKIKSKNNKIKVLFLIALRDLHNCDNFKNWCLAKTESKTLHNDADFLDDVYCILY